MTFNDILIVLWYAFLGLVCIFLLWLVQAIARVFWLYWEMAIGGFAGLRYSRRIKRERRNKR
jgi:hypothetical protein